jgi:hypothetical protein
MAQWVTVERKTKSAGNLHRPARTALAILLLVLAFPLLLAAQQNAQLPYDTAYRYLAFFTSLDHLERIAPSLLITSTNPAVKPEEIEFKLVEGGDWIIFKPDPTGVIEFPANEDWLGSQRVMISNQPKGTLQLQVGFHARPVESMQLPYSELMIVTDQFGEALAALAELQGRQPPTVHGLTIQMPPNASVTVHTRPRPRDMKPNAAGLVVLTRDPALIKENPEVEFSELPLGILPLQ